MAPWLRGRQVRSSCGTWKQGSGSAHSPLRNSPMSRGWSSPQMGPPLLPEQRIMSSGSGTGRPGARSVPGRWKDRRSIWSRWPLHRMGHGWSRDWGQHGPAVGRGDPEGGCHAGWWLEEILGLAAHFAARYARNCGVWRRGGAGNLRGPASPVKTANSPGPPSNEGEESTHRGGESCPAMHPAASLPKACVWIAEAPGSVLKEFRTDTNSV